MNKKQIAISALKETLAELEAAASPIRAAIAALGGTAAGTSKVTSIRNGGGRKGHKPEAAIQAAGDARAVKAGTPTPEQQERYNARQAKKAAKVPKGASLASAAS